MNPSSMWNVIALTLLTALVAGPARADEWSHLTGDPFGARSKLEEKGISFEIALVSDFSKNFMGGINTEGVNAGYLLDATITLDTKRLGLWPGGEFLINYTGEAGEYPSRDVGDLQLIDNNEADGRSELYELWYQQKLFDDHVRIKVGKIDANIDFDSLELGGDFLHSSVGHSPTILGFAAYPDPATAVEVFIAPNDRWYLGLAVFDGASLEGKNTGTRGPSTFFGPPSDLFLIAEGGVHWHLQPDKHPGRLAGGIWRHTGTIDRFDGGTDDGTCGLYLLAEQTFWSDGDRLFGGFLQYGWADPNVSTFEHHIGAGLTFNGPLEARPNDAMGLMTSCAILSDEPGAGFDHRHETAIELFYKIQIFPWFTVQPDLQYVINPGGVEEHNNALAAIVRVTIDF